MKRLRLFGALRPGFLALVLMGVVLLGATSPQTAVGSVNQAQTPTITISKVMLLDVTGAQNTPNNRDYSLGGYTILFNVYAGVANSGSTVDTVNLVLGQNDQDQGNLGKGSAGANSTTATLTVDATYTVCEVTQASNGTDTVPLNVKPRPDLSTGGTYQTSQPYPKCIVVTLTGNGNSSLKFLDTQASPATLTVNKVLVPSNDPGKFNLQIDGATAGTGANVGNGGTTGAVTVTPGVKHTVGETAGTGTNLADYTAVIGGACAADGSITLSAGENKICTITNTNNSATLIVKKVVTNDNGGTAVPSDFSLHVKSGGADVSGSPQPGSGAGTSYTLGAGTYTVSEGTTPAGYSGSFSGACDSNGNVTLAAGETKTCTVTNDDIAPKLTLIKQVDNTNGGTAQATDFTLSATGPTTISGKTPVVSGSTFEAGTYTLSETSLQNYTAGAWSCQGGTLSGSQITLGLGDTATCTVTNTYQAPTPQSGTLIVKKVVDNAGGGTKGASDFSFQVNGGAAQGFDASGTNTLSVSAGTYTVTEPAVSDYTASYNNCSNVQVSAGGTTTCTITNKYQAPSPKTGTLTVTKSLSPASDPGRFDLQIDGVTKKAGAGNNDTTGAVSVTAGTYTVSEAASGGTSLSDYNSSISCTDGSSTASGTSLSGVNVAANANVVCTITNTRKPSPAPQKASIQITKSMSDGTNLAGYAVTYQIFENATGTGAQISNSPLYVVLSGTSGTNSVTGLNPDTYTVCEIPTATKTGASAVGLTVNGITGSGVSNPSTNGDCYTFTVAAGNTAGITFNNSKKQSGGGGGSSADLFCVQDPSGNWSMRSATKGTPEYNAIVSGPHQTPQGGQCPANPPTATPAPGPGSGPAAVVAGAAPAAPPAPPAAPTATPVPPTATPLPRTVAAAPAPTVPAPEVKGEQPAPPPLPASLPNTGEAGDTSPGYVWWAVAGLLSLMASLLLRRLGNKRVLAAFAAASGPAKFPIVRWSQRPGYRRLTIAAVLVAGALLLRRLARDR